MKKLCIDTKLHRKEPLTKEKSLVGDGMEEFWSVQY